MLFLQWTHRMTLMELYGVKKYSSNGRIDRALMGSPWWYSPESELHFGTSLREEFNDTRLELLTERNNDGRR